MLIEDYENMVRKTSLYPSSHVFVYPALGLANEVGETLDKVFPTDRVEMVTTEVVKELGDVLWYVVATTHDLNLKLWELFRHISGDMNVTTFDALEWWLLEGDKKRSPYLSLTVHAGEIAGIAKKVIRDGRGLEDARVKAEPVLARVLYDLCLICKRIGVPLSEIAKTNYDKLTSRLERGKIKGDGDNR